VHRVGIDQLLLSNVLLPVEECTSVRTTLHSTLRDDFGRNTLQDAFHATYLLDIVHLFVIRNAASCLPGHGSRFGHGLSLLL